MTPSTEMVEQAARLRRQLTAIDDAVADAQETLDALETLLGMVREDGSSLYERSPARPRTAP